MEHDQVFWEDGAFVEVTQEHDVVEDQQVQTPREQRIEADPEEAECIENLDTKLAELCSVISSANHQCDTLTGNFIIKSAMEIKAKTHMKEHVEMCTMISQQQEILEKATALNAQVQNLFAETKYYDDQFQIGLIHQKHMETEANTTDEYLKRLCDLKIESDRRFQKVEAHLSLLEDEAEKFRAKFNEKKNSCHDMLNKKQSDIKDKENELKLLNEQFDHKIQELQLEYKNNEKIQAEWQSKIHFITGEWDVAKLELEQAQENLAQSETAKSNLEMAISNVNLDELEKAAIENETNQKNVLDEINMKISNATQRLDEAQNRKNEVKMKLNEKNIFAEELLQKIMSLEQEHCNVLKKNKQLREAISSEQTQFNTMIDSHKVEISKAKGKLCRQKERNKLLLEKQDEILQRSEAHTKLVDNLKQKKDNLVDNVKKLNNQIQEKNQCIQNLKGNCKEIESNIFERRARLNKDKTVRQQETDSHKKEVDNLKLCINEAKLKFAKSKIDCDLKLEAELSKRDFCKKIIHEDSIERKMKHEKSMHSLRDNLQLHVNKLQDKKAVVEAQEAKKAKMEELCIELRQKLLSKKPFTNLSANRESNVLLAEKLHNVSTNEIIEPINESNKINNAIQTLQNDKNSEDNFAMEVIDLDDTSRHSFRHDMLLSRDPKYWEDAFDKLTSDP